MKSTEIRQTFIDYFKKHGHTYVPSAPTIPADDPTLLFTNAGMNQFKNTFLGLETRDYKRATNSQKCVRAGGKHNDLESVGRTARHHTFFEMMGNFSFADYFKKDAIHFAWDMLTREIGFDKDRLYVTVFETDDEAAEIWHKQEGVPKERIFRFGEKDNFWRMGESGPCGPNSEIFFDHGETPGENPDPYKNIAGGGDRFVEIWNLVFMQYNETAPGQMTPLTNPSIDTGAGLERWCAALQGRPNNYDTDLFWPIISRAAALARIEYDENPKSRPQTREYQEKLTALRVLADHARAAAFLISDGVLPSNEGRGYVLRRIIRRAIRYARNLTGDSLFPVVVETVIQQMGDFFTELKTREKLILSNAHDEEKRFLTTLDSGSELLFDSLKKLENSGQKVLAGETVFKLYDTYGFPVDLTKIMAEENGYQIDEAGFSACMEQAKERARSSWKGGQSNEQKDHLMTLSSQQPETQFTGYDELETSGQVLSMSDGEQKVESLSEGQRGFLIFDRTPCYAESGGQTADQAEILQNGHIVAEVFDVQKFDKVFVHSVECKATLSLGTYDLRVRQSTRREIANHHSATHLLHEALRQTLGEHVGQSGSLVEKNRLRLDFTHNSPLSADQVSQLERLVNEQVALALPVASRICSKDQAVADGALALFGEKYEDQVRVIQMGKFSTELCGGTHVSNTSQIRLFTIVSESGVSSGIRRIEALCGHAAVDYLNQHRQEHEAALSAAGAQQSWRQFIEGGKEKLNLREWVEKKSTQLRELEKQLQAAKSSSVDLDTVINQASNFETSLGSARFAVLKVDNDERKVLSDITDKLRDKIQTGVVMVGGQGAKSSPLFFAVTKNLSKEQNAGRLLKQAAEILGGKGGGRPDFAQGAATDLSRWEDAVASVEQSLGIK